jgi:tetratricopeptide (TPR) repeat protein
MRRISIYAVRFAVALVFLGTKTGLSQQPTDPLVDPLAEARTFLAAGELAKSDASVRAYLSQHDTSADAHFLLGYVLFREEKARDSLAEFTAGAAIRRPNADELKTVASDYVLLGDFSDADRWFSEVTAQHPLDADAWYLLGRTQYNEGSYEAGASSFQRALALHPKYVEAEDNLGLCLRELNKLDEAKAAFQTAIDWEGSAPTDPQPYLNLGTLLLDQGDADTAIPYLARAVALAPANPKFHEALGSAYETRNDLSKAQAELERAVALAPKTSGLHFQLAQIYRKEGLRDQAQREFALCAKLNSTHSSPETPNPFLPKAPEPH